MNVNVPNQILSLVALANAGLPADSDRRISVTDVRQFIAGCRLAAGAESAALTFIVPTNECAVVVCIEHFNVDTADPLSEQKLTIGESGIAATRTEIPSQWAMGGDVFYVFGSGKATFTLKASPESGKFYFARAVGFYLPTRTLERLSRVGTRVVSLDI